MQPPENRQLVEGFMMIRTLQIPKGRWKTFTRLLNRQLGERPVRVEVVGRQLGDQEMGNLLPFHSLEFDAKGSERGALTLTIGSEQGRLIHRITSPTRMYAGQNETGLIEWLAIEEVGDLGEAETIVHFEEPPLLMAEHLDEQTPAS
jgi:hypothetical protein